MKTSNILKQAIVISMILSLLLIGAGCKNGKSSTPFYGSGTNLPQYGNPYGAFAGYQGGGGGNTGSAYPNFPLGNEPTPPTGKAQASKDDDGLPTWAWGLIGGGIGAAAIGLTWGIVEAVKGGDEEEAPPPGKTPPTGQRVVNAPPTGPVAPKPVAKVSKEECDKLLKRVEACFASKGAQALTPDEKQLFGKCDKDYAFFKTGAMGFQGLFETAERLAKAEEARVAAEGARTEAEEKLATATADIAGKEQLITTQGAQLDSILVEWGVERKDLLATFVTTKTKKQTGRYKTAGGSAKETASGTWGKNTSLQLLAKRTVDGTDYYFVKLPGQHYGWVKADVLNLTT